MGIRRTSGTVLLAVLALVLLGAPSCQSKWGQTNAAGGPSVSVRVGTYWQNGKKIAKFAAYSAAVLLGGIAAHHVFSKDPCLTASGSEIVAKFPDAKGAVNTPYLTCGKLSSLNTRGGQYYNDGWVIQCIAAVTSAVSPVALGTGRQRWSQAGRRVTAQTGGLIVHVRC